MAVKKFSAVREKALTTKWDIEERTSLVVSVFRGEQRRWEALCLNEMALHRSR